MATDLQRAYEALKNKVEEYNKLWDYYDGAHPLEYNASKLRDIFGELDATFNENWCAVVVNNILDRIQVEKVQISGRDLADEWWIATELDLESYDAHLCTLVTGEAFLIYHEDEGVREVYYNDSRYVHMFYDDKRPRDPRFAAKRWEEENEFGTSSHIMLYYPDRLEHYIANKKWSEIGTWTAFQPAPDDLFLTPNIWGEIPVFHIRRERRGIFSELADIIPLQAQLNKLLADMMIAAEFGAFRQRYVISELAMRGKLKNAPNEIWDIPAGAPDGQKTEVGEFGATDLSNYLQAIDRAANVIATLSGIPKTLLFAVGDVPSGASLRALEGPLIKKAERYERRWEPIWRKVISWLSGFTIDPNDVDLIWSESATSDPETQATTAESWVKAGMPLKTVLRRQGWSDAELAQLEKDLEEEQTRNASLAEAYIAQAEINASRQGGENGPQTGDNTESGG